MKYLTLKLAVIGTLGLVASPVMAGWLVGLPAAGYAVTGGTTAYALCNPTGNFGSGLAVKASPGVNDACAVFPTSEAVPPDSTYPTTPISIASRPVVMNNTYTGGVNKTVGTVTEYVWRKAVGSTYECIYGAKVVNNSTDYHTSPGNQYFEVNDIARAGFSGLNIDVAYSTVPTVSEPVYRVGRTYTAVQNRPQPGYVARPLTGSSASINGVNAWPTPAGSPTAAQQTADLNSNWVNFTTDVNYFDDDGSTAAASGMVYVRSACSAAAPVAVAGAIRLRQTFQELAGDGATNNNFIEVSVSGFVPPGGTATPAHTDPY